MLFDFICCFRLNVIDSKCPFVGLAADAVHHLGLSLLAVDDEEQYIYRFGCDGMSDHLTWLTIPETGQLRFNAAIGEDLFGCIPYTSSRARQMRTTLSNLVDRYCQLYIGTRAEPRGRYTARLTTVELTCELQFQETVVAISKPVRLDLTITLD